MNISCKLIPSTNGSVTIYNYKAINVASMLIEMDMNKWRNEKLHNHIICSWAFCARNLCEHPSCNIMELNCTKLHIFQVNVCYHIQWSVFSIIVATRLITLIYKYILNWKSSLKFKNLIANRICGKWKTLQLLFYWRAMMASCHLKLSL
jgi:hypothetical protein